MNMGVLNASDYGVPQNRRRAIIIGKLNGDAPQLPAPLENLVTVWDAISDLAFLESGEGEECQNYPEKPQTEYQKELRVGSTKLHNVVFARVFHKYCKNIDAIESEETSIEEITAESEQRKAQVDSISAFMFELHETGEPITEFDSKLWLSVIDCVVVRHNGTLLFRFRNVMEIEG